MTFFLSHLIISNIRFFFFSSLVNNLFSFSFFHFCLFSIFSGNNNFLDLKRLKRLDKFPALTNVRFFGNPVWENPKYNQTVVDLCPNLQVLDQTKKEKIDFSGKKQTTKRKREEKEEEGRKKKKKIEGNAHSQN